MAMRLPLTRERTPFCTAPFTAVLVDPDKGVRPCCDFEGHLGNLEQESLSDVLGGAGWTQLRDQVSRGELPHGCESCYKREKATGWSVRRNFMDATAAKNGKWAKGLTEVEINSTNVCNLTCTHCGPQFSTGWLPLVAKLQQKGVPHYRGLEQRILRGDPGRMVAQLAGLDLGHLDVVRFKGGEPMLNPDVPAVLRALRERGVLEHIDVAIVSNGTTINEEVLDLLRTARRVILSLSIDGTGPVQEYIRRGPSAISRIEEFIAAFATLERIEFRLSVSVMAYNVFSLDRIAAWWNGLRARYPGKARYVLCFPLEVIEPPILSIRVLSDATRRRLVDKYRRLSDADYSHVIKSLKLPFAGARIHNDFVAYTRAIDETTGTNVLEVVPELAPEMIVLPLPAPTEKKRGLLATWKGLFSPASQGTEIDPLDRGVALSRAGKNAQALRFYDRFLQGDALRHPRSWQIRLHRAIVLAKLERWRPALQELERVVGTNPRAVLARMQDAEQGNDHYGELLKTLPESLRVEFAILQTPPFRLLMQGLAHRAADEEVAAAAALDRALAMDPGFMLARTARETARATA